MSNSDNNTNQPRHSPADEHHENGPDETRESTDGESHYDTDSSGPPPLLTESESGASCTASMTTDASSDQDLDGFDLGGSTIHDVDEDRDGWDAFEARLELVTWPPDRSPPGLWTSAGRTLPPPPVDPAAGVHRGATDPRWHGPAKPQPMG